ncbi:hypothetical protein C4K26_6167 [Pseudomonas chlororaphis]|nr:hypothetical protein C4K26_6167 [Pseudomonas chlororaphis]
MKVESLPSVEGGGFGKSSLKNLITEQLKSRNNGVIWLVFLKTARVG